MQASADLPPQSSLSTCGSPHPVLQPARTCAQVQTFVKRQGGLPEAEQAHQLLGAEGMETLKAMLTGTAMIVPCDAAPKAACCFRELLDT